MKTCLSPWEKMVNSKRNTTLKDYHATPKSKFKPSFSLLSSYQKILCHIKFAGRLQNKTDKFCRSDQETGFKRLS